MTIDPVCLVHGKRRSEHPGGRCLFCALCFEPLTPEECHRLPDGTREDVCYGCAQKEQDFLARCWRVAAWACLKRRWLRSAARALGYGLYFKVPVPQEWPDGTRLVGGTPGDDAVPVYGAPPGLRTKK